MQRSSSIPATVLRILTPSDRKFPFPGDCSGTVGALKVSFIIIRSGVVVPELSLKFTSSAGVVAAVAIKYSCFGCRARTFITICAICKPQDCFNKELVRCLSVLRRVVIVCLHPMLCWTVLLSWELHNGTKKFLNSNHIRNNRYFIRITLFPVPNSYSLHISQYTSLLLSPTNSNQ